MKSTDLNVLWAAPDNTRVTSRQYSFRLPVHVAAKIEALGELYPTRTRTQIVADLLASALDGVEDSFPPVQGKQIGRDSISGEMLYEDTGMVTRFRKIANKHFAEIEKELGNERPDPLYAGPAVIFEHELEKK